MNEKYARQQFHYYRNHRKKSTSQYPPIRKQPKHMKKYMICLLKEILTEAIAQKKIADRFMEKITGHRNYFILKLYIISNKEMIARLRRT